MSDVAEHTETDIWASPTRDSPDQGRPKTPKTPKTPKSPKTPAGQGRQMEPEDRDAMLRKEIEGIRSINVAVEGIIGTLERTGGNMNVRANLLSIEPPTDGLPFRFVDKPPRPYRKL